MSDSIEILRLGEAGDGVARGSNDATLHIPGVLPGEVVALGADGAPAILRAAPERVSPPCPHARPLLCGGCALQHMASTAQAAWKRDRIVAALQRRGVDATVDATWIAPEASRRRLGLGARRLKGGVRLGFHSRGSDRILDVDHCRIATPAFAAAWPALRRLAGLACPRSRAVALAVTATDSGFDVAVRDGKPLDDPARWGEAAAWAETEDVARLTWNGEPVALRRPPLVRMGRAAVTLPADSFLQASAEAEAFMADEAVAWLDGAARVGDLFAGCGAFALRLAERADVLAIDGDADATAALGAAARATLGLRRVAVLARDLFRRPLLPTELEGLDAVVIDPPRAGAEAQVEMLAQAWVGRRGVRLAMISCAPASFARDAAILVAGGWRLARVTPVDQFRHSAHVELVARFER